MYFSRKIISISHLTLACFCIILRDAAAQSVLSLIEKEITALVSNACPSVVTVSAHTTQSTAKKPDEGIFPFWSSEETAGSTSEIRIGSGLIISPDGFILTRYSVIENAQKVFVTIVGNHKLKAEVVGSDSAAMIALLRVTETTLTAARLGRAESVLPGAWAIVIGNSMGMAHAVSVGSVNGMHEDGMMQISANVDPGHSGSPVFNSAGEAIGLIAAVVNYEPEGEFSSGSYFGHSTLVWPMSFLLPRARKLIDDYYAEHGWLGVTVNRVGKKGQHGVKVVQLDESGPGQKAGIRLDDIITHVDGKQLKSISDLRMLVLKHKPGDQVEVGLLRQDATVKIRAEIGRKRGEDYFRDFAPAEMSAPAGSAPRPRQ